MNEYNTGSDFTNSLYVVIENIQIEAVIRMQSLIIVTIKVSFFERNSLMNDVAKYAVRSAAMPVNNWLYKSQFAFCVSYGTELW